MSRILNLIATGGLALGLGLALAAPASAQGHDHGAPGQAPSVPATGSVRITMEALHAAGGVPPGWRFTLPAGDAAAGRQAFVALKCYACHAVEGAPSPLPAGQSATAGPELTGMGAHHPAEYLAESIVNPSAVIIEGAGYAGGDGRSIMPAYPDMTLAQLVDLVAYLKTLGAPEAGHAHDEGATEKVVGGYRVRLAYAAAESHHHDARGGGMMMMDMPGRLQVFLTEATSGQPIPYTPVTARIATSGKPARTVTLAPSLGDRGFFYGADVTLPDKTTRITLSIGPSTMKLGPGAPEGLKRTQTVSFDWK